MALSKRGVICLTRTLGDVVLGNVLVKNIKLRYPEMLLDYVVEENYLSLVEDNPGISKVISIKNTNEEWGKILKTIASKEYDEVFCAQQTSPTDNMWHHHLLYNKKHLLYFYAKRCGIKIVDPILELFVSGCLEGDWSYLIKPVVAIHTKTLVDVKDWSYFTALVKKLKEWNYTIVQLGKESDGLIEGAQFVKLSLKEIMQFFKEKQCDIFVGLDSGLSYVAAAFKIPTIALYGSSDVITSGVYGESVDVILAENHQACKDKRGGIRCHGILNGKCGFGQKCIDTITVEQVIEKIGMILHKKGVL